MNQPLHGGAESGNRYASAPLLHGKVLIPYANLFWHEINENLAGEEVPGAGVGVDFALRCLRQCKEWPILFGTTPLNVRADDFR